MEVLARRHAGLLALLGAGVVLRVLAMLAIWPGIWFSDSNPYVLAAARGVVSVVRVSGYSAFVAIFYRLGHGGAAALIVTQHLIGLGVVVALYALLLRRGVSRLVACLAVAPLALDAYVIDLEHMIMSETIFDAVLVAAVIVLLWSDRLEPAAAAAGGLLLGYAGIVRSVAVPAIAVFAVYLLARRVGWRALAAFGVGWIVVIAGYAALFDVQHGRFGFSEWGGRFLYGKVAPFANCAQMPGLPASERPLCPDPTFRLTVDGYLWGRFSPIRGLGPQPRIGDFAKRVILAQPAHYAGVVALDFLHYFEPGHRIAGSDYPVGAWQFPSHPRLWGRGGYRGPIRRGFIPRLHGTDPSVRVNPMVGRPIVRPALSKALHYYQSVFYTSGVLLAACVILVAVALALRRGARRLRLDAALLAGTALVALAVTAALSLFDYRYGLPAVVLLPAAGALAWTSLREEVRR